MKAYNKSENESMLLKKHGELEGDTSALCCKVNEVRNVTFYMIKTLRL